MKKKLERYYSHRAHTYEDLDEPRSIVACVRTIGVKDHMRIISPKRDDKILDVGCGIGRFLKPFSISKVYGADMTSDMLEKAKDLGIPLTRCDGEYLSFKDRSFDITHSAGLLGVYRSRKIIDEIARVTKSGGRIFVSFPAANSVSGFVVSLFRRLRYNPSLLDFWYTEEEIREMFPKNARVSKIYRLGWEPPFQRLVKEIKSEFLSKSFMFLEGRLRDKPVFKYFGGRFLVEAVKH
ncbi:MAG: class I SAM-dependent methyltransferase [Candidatus Hydrothermarchaeales archaeon]